MLTSNQRQSKENNTKVRVILVTYNHEKWVAQAINSLLMQKANFEYEIVIVEDCSTDSTRDIVMDFQQRYPERIHLVLSEKNSEVRTNFAKAFLASPSQYVVRLDGDDYWTSPHKLQMQADFLDAHPECAICFHNVMRLYEDGSQEPKYGVNHYPKKISTLEDLLARKVFPGPTPMLRAGLFSEFPGWYYTSPVGDRPLYILCAQHGKIGYIDEVLAVYRIHSGGMWSGISEIQKVESQLKFYKNMDANLYFRYKEVNDKQVFQRYWYFQRLARGKAEELEEHLSKQAAKDTKVWSTLQKALSAYRHPTAPVELVDVSLWDPDPEEGRWLAWQLQILLIENMKVHKMQKKRQQQEVRRLRKRMQDLRRELRGIQNSTTWKLLRGLGHLEAKLPGKSRG